MLRDQAEAVHLFPTFQSTQGEMRSKKRTFARFSRDRAERSRAISRPGSRTYEMSCGFPFSRAFAPRPFVSSAVSIRRRNRLVKIRSTHHVNHSRV